MVSSVVVDPMHTADGGVLADLASRMVNGMMKKDVLDSVDDMIRR
jgi:hypothetical protein